jgi:hypothetical protein
MYSSNFSEETSLNFLLRKAAMMMLDFVCEYAWKTAEKNATAERCTKPANEMMSHAADFITPFAFYRSPQVTPPFPPFSS